MKTKSTFAALLLCVFALFPSAVQAQTNNLTVLLQQGLFEEQANRNLDAAIASYQSLAAQFDKDRQIAATAVFRLGECYRALGKTNEAAAQYQRILKDFSDEQTLVTLSRQNLTGMGVAASKSFTERGATVVTSQRARELELVKKLQAMPLSEIRQVAPTFLTDGTLINLINQYNQCELDLVRLRVDYAEENPQVKRTVVIRDEMGKKIMERLEGLSHAISLDLAASENVTDTSAEANSKPVTDEEESEIVRIQQMIQNSPDLINARVDGSTPLAKAAANGWLKVATYLMDHGAAVKGSYALSAAVNAGNRAMVELLLSRGADVNEMDNSYGRTLLQTAVQKGYQSVAEVLLANKADVNAQANSGDTALDAAASASQSKIIKLLLTAGANPNVENKIGRTSLSFAAERGSPEMVKLLLDAKADPNGRKRDVPLIWAVQEQDAASAELLLQAGANPDATGGTDLSDRRLVRSADLMNRNGHLTPLWLAIYMKQLPMVQLLLKFKADPNDSQTDGQSLLFSAIDQPDILAALLAAGGKVDAHTSPQNGTLLSGAIADTNAASVEILLKHGANPNATDNQGNTPLHVATDNLAGDKIFQLLFDSKADPNVRNNQGRTPLEGLKQILKDNPSLEKIYLDRFEHVADVLRQHGALDKLPDWDRITVSRPSANFSQAVFAKGTNDWNQFTLLEAILNFYEDQSASARLPTGTPFQQSLARIIAQSQSQPYSGSLAFPDLAQVTVVRHHPGTTNETRIKVNLLNSTNGIDCAKDVPLELGDVVEIPERNHALGDQPIGLTGGEVQAIANYLKGSVQLVAHGQKVELTIFPNPTQSLVRSVLSQPDAQKVLLSSSDLSRVKVIRRDAKTGKNHEWIVDCSKQANDIRDLWLRNGDVIEVPEKP